MHDFYCIFPYSLQTTPQTHLPCLQSHRVLGLGVIPTTAEIFEEEREQSPAPTQLVMLQCWAPCGPLQPERTQLLRVGTGHLFRGWRAERGGQRVGRELGQPGPGSHQAAT